MKKVIFLLFVFISSVSYAQLDPPEIRCIEVLNNGDVRITWNPTTGPGPMSQFVEYVIFSKPFGFPAFSRIDSTSSTFDIDASSIGNIDYQVFTKYDNGISTSLSSASNTVSKILLSVAKSTPNDFPPILTWNPPFATLPASSTGLYKIWRKTKGGPSNYAQIGTHNSTGSSTESFIDNSIIRCSKNIAYKVTIEDALGCSSVSTVDSALFEEKTQPLTPSIDSVSVDTNSGGVKLSWTNSTSDDVKAHEIYYLDPSNNWVLLNTIPLSSSSFLFDQTVDLNLAASYFKVVAVDSCGNKSADSPFHRSIFLDATANSCNRTIELNWNLYEGWSSVSSYEIYISENFGPMKFVATISNTESSFIHEDRNTFTKYRYYLKATGGVGGRSTSNAINVIFDDVELPDYQYLRYVTVSNLNQVEAMCLVDTNADVVEYSLMRSLRKVGPFVKVAASPFDSYEKGGMVTIIDTTANPNQTAYFYRVDAIDNCGKPLLVSNVSKTVYVDVEDSKELTVNKLEWNKYIGWDTLGKGVKSYRIYRSFLSDSGGIKIDSTNSATREYFDLTEESIQESSQFCYVIEAIQRQGGLYTFKDKSRSNVFCVENEPDIWVPSVFTPNNDGLNDEFKPIVNYSDAENYTLTIFNRWGEYIFTSSNPTIGWDGRFDLNIAPTGTYIYHIQFLTSQGSEYERRGAFTLVR